MFVLSTFSDQIRVLPADLNKRRLEAVAQEIEKTYIDKVRDPGTPPVFPYTNVWLGAAPDREHHHSRPLASRVIATARRARPGWPGRP